MFDVSSLPDWPFFLFSRCIRTAPDTIYFWIFHNPSGIPNVSKSKSHLVSLISGRQLGRGGGGGGREKWVTVNPRDWGKWIRGCLCQLCEMLLLNSIHCVSIKPQPRPSVNSESVREESSSVEEGESWSTFKTFIKLNHAHFITSLMDFSREDMYLQINPFSKNWFSRADSQWLLTLTFCLFFKSGKNYSSRNINLFLLVILYIRGRTVA